MKRLILVDGNNMAFRAFFTHKNFINSKDKNTGTIFGIIQSILALKNKPKLFSDKIIMAWDGGKCSYRHNPYTEYKAGRTNYAETCPEFQYFYPQIKETQEILKLMKINQIKVKGVEADDLIGIMSRVFKKYFEEIIIISNDKDFCQLVKDNVKLYDPIDKTWIDSRYIKTKYGIEKQYIKDYKTLVGDKSDNIKGINGIGPQKATKLINEFGSLKNILKKSDKIKGEDIEKALLFYKLITILKKVDNDSFSDEQKAKTRKRIKRIYKRLKEYQHVDLKKVREKFMELEFTSLLKFLNNFYH